MGLSCGLKKLERLRSLGVEGTELRLSMVLSVKEGREDLRWIPEGPVLESCTSPTGSGTSSSSEGCRAAAGKLSREVSWS
jgi:hypothetical protein